MSARRRHWLDRLALRTTGSHGRAVSRPDADADAYRETVRLREDAFSRTELLGQGARLSTAAILAVSLGLLRIPAAQARTLPDSSCVATCVSEYQSAVGKAALRCSFADLSKTNDFFFKNPFTYLLTLGFCSEFVVLKGNLGINACVANCKAKKEPAPAPTAAQLAPPPSSPPIVDAEGALSDLGCCNGAPGNLKCCYDLRNTGGRCCVASVSCKDCVG